MLDELEHLVGYRVRLGAVERLPVEHDRDDEEQAGQNEHQEEDVLDRLAQVQEREAQ